jgi:AcrR family transcriptional regulator
VSQPHLDSPQDTRQRLIEAALLVFAEKGFDGVGIREIAVRAKANSAMVQYHFEGKEGLYVQVISYIMERITCTMKEMPSPPESGDPDCRQKAIEWISSHIRVMLYGAAERCWIEQFRSLELGQAAQSLLNRETLAPRDSVVDLLTNAIRPLFNSLTACIHLLRPDLEEEELFLMGASIHGQLFYIRKHFLIVQRMRGREYAVEEMPGLVDHFVQFCLRGLGIPEAFPAQGA